MDTRAAMRARFGVAPHWISRKKTEADLTKGLPNSYAFHTLAGVRLLRK